MSRSDRIDSSVVLNTFVILFGCWTIYSNLHSFIGSSFANLLSFAFAPFLAAAFLLIYCYRAPVSDAASETSQPPKSIPILPGITIAGGLVALLWLTQNYLLFWALATVFLILPFALNNSPRMPGTPASPVQQSSSTLWLSLLVLTAVTVTLFAHRPDIDDAFYLNLATAALDYPDQVLFRFDTMHGEIGLPLLLDAYRVHSYELLVALGSFVTDVPPATFYYLIFPAIFAAMVVIAHWNAIKQFFPGTVAFGVVLVLITLVAWGDSHRTYGNFSFVRLFQGKGALVAVCIPAIVYYATRYSRQPGFRNWLLLSFAQIAAIGFSSTGLVVAPLAAGTALLGGWRPNRQSSQSFAIGLLASLYVVAVTILIWLQSRTGSVSLTQTAASVTPTVAELSTVLGAGVRSYATWFALLAIPVLQKYSPLGRMLLGYVLALMLIILNPWTSGLLSQYVAANMSWRVFWSVPFPLIIGLAGAGFVLSGPRMGVVRVGTVGAVILVVSMVLFPDTWTLSKNNHTRMDLPGYKVDQGYNIAREVVRLTPRSGTVLAPTLVSHWIPTLRGYPKSIVVRRHYIRLIRSALGNQEASTRLALLDLVEGTRINEVQYLSLVRTLTKRDIDTVVLSPDLPWLKTLGEQLKLLGYHRNSMRKWQIWTKSRS